MGWQCPGCGACYSPSTSACARCVGSGAAVFVPSAFTPSLCLHLRCNEETAGRRCVDCGYLVPMFIFHYAPGSTLATTGTVTHCEHGRTVGIDACHECQVFPTVS